MPDCHDTQVECLLATSGNEEIVIEDQTTFVAEEEDAVVAWEDETVAFWVTRKPKDSNGVKYDLLNERDKEKVQCAPIERNSWVARTRSHENDESGRDRPVSRRVTRKHHSIRHA